MENVEDIFHSTSLLEIVLLSGRVIDDNCRWVGLECGFWWKRKKGRGWCWSRLGGNDIVGRRIVGLLAKCFLIASFMKLMQVGINIFSNLLIKVNKGKACAPRTFSLIVVDTS